MGLTEYMLEDIKASDMEGLDISYGDMSDKGVMENLVLALNENKKIKMLRLYQCSVNDKGAEILAGAKHLTHLELDENNIGPDGTRYLAANKKLVKLNLSGNQIGLNGAKALAKNTKLGELILAGCKLRDDGAKVLLSTESKALTKLDLNTNDINKLYAQDVKNLTLIDLDLSQNYIDDEGVKFIVSNFPELTSLNLGTNVVGDSGVETLASHEKLVVLDLRQNQATEKGFRALLCGNNKIETLCIYGNEISFSINESLPIDNSITHLNLSFNKINDAPETPLESIASFTNLKELILEENNLSADVAKQFYNKMDSMPEIEFIDLRSGSTPMLFSCRRKKIESPADNFSGSKIMKLSI